MCNVPLILKNQNIEAGRNLKILFDTEGAKNYVKPVKELKNVIAVENPFAVSSIHGSSKITNTFLRKTFGQTSPFFVLDTLSSTPS